MDETRSPPLRSVLCYWPEMSRLASVDIMLMNASLFELIPFLVHSIDFSSGGCWGGEAKGDGMDGGTRKRRKQSSRTGRWRTEMRGNKSSEKMNAIGHEASRGQRYTQPATN